MAGPGDEPDLGAAGDHFLCKHLSPPQGDGVQAVKDQQTLLELKSNRGEADSQAGFGPQLSTQKPVTAVNRLRFQALLDAWMWSAESPKPSWPICPLSSSQGGPALLSHDSPVVGKVSGPTTRDLPSAFDPCQPLKSPSPQPPAVSSSPEQPWLPQSASVPRDPGGDKGNKWRRPPAAAPPPGGQGAGPLKVSFPSKSRIGSEGGGGRVEFCK